MPEPEPRLNYADPARQSKRWAWWVWIPVVFFTGLAVLVLLVVGAIAFWVHNVNPASSPAESRCAANLERIGQALSQYTTLNAGQYPPSFATLVLSGGLTTDVLVCNSISCNDFPATGSTPRIAAENLQTPGTCSYVYLGTGLVAMTTPKNAVIAYEASLANHGGTGGNVLFADGHVAFEPGSWMMTLQVKLVRKGAASQPTTMPTD